ncbi:MAG: hypothetical protein ACLRWP_11795 [Bilophila wadsworthia]
MSHPICGRRTRGAPQHPSVAQSLLPVAWHNRRAQAADLLEETLAVFREHRGERPVRHRQNAGREETKWLGKLSIPAAEVDISTLIIISGPGSAGSPSATTQLCGGSRKGEREPEERGQRLSEGKPFPSRAFRPPVPAGALPGLRKAKTLTNLLCIITYWGNAKS